MGGKYEIRYYDDEQPSFCLDVYTNNWFKFRWLRLTKKVIYYKVYGRN